MLKEWFFYVGNVILALPIRLFIRKIHFNKTENFVKNKPVLIACNHPNSFLDGIVFEKFFRRKIYSLTRGDVFAKPVVNHLFRSVRLLPIFRSTDADADVARSGNNRTFIECYEKFKKNYAILIFSEGISKPEKAVRKLKKGTVALAIDALKRSNFELDLYLVPAALNYQSFFTLRRNILVQFSKPIRMLDYADEIKANELEVVKKLTVYLEENFERNVIQTEGVNKEEREFAHTMMANDNHRPLAFKAFNKWNSDISRFNNAESDLLQKVKEYRAQVGKAKVLDANVSNRSFDYISVFIAIFTFGVSFPFFVVCYALWHLALKITNAKVKNNVFTDSFILGVGMVLLLIPSIAVIVYFFNVYQSFWPILFSIGAFYGTICWFNTVDEMEYLWKQIRWVGLSESEKQSLVAQRSAIMQELA
jgi:1-acyl-sn-glycerol-3-phosphate acyltransferase